MRSHRSKKKRTKRKQTRALNLKGEEQLIILTNMRNQESSR